MQLSSKLAGIAGSGAMITVIYTGYFTGIHPWDLFLLTAGGTALMAFLGYQLGNILSNPQGKPKSESPEPTQDTQTPPPNQAHTSDPLPETLSATEEGAGDTPVEIPSPEKP
jgi:hypothetical protein